MGSRLEYWRKSLGFIAEAPLIGHGTGSIRGLFAGVAADADVDPLRGEIVSNPHNQTLSVAVQWGVAGRCGSLCAVVCAFADVPRRGAGLLGSACWSWCRTCCPRCSTRHLFDFAPGWIYVLGVGVAGGMALAKQAKIVKAS